VLPQLMYGCTVRSIPRKMLADMGSRAAAIGLHRSPLMLSTLRAPKIAAGPPLGAAAMRHPELEVLLVGARWLQALANDDTKVGRFHRSLAWSDGEWKEPTPALRDTIQRLGPSGARW